jgi:hypothetical protein
MNEFLTDGSMSFSGGVNSLKPTTVASDKHPDGLPRNQLAWLNNATVRGGGITSRYGWKFLRSVTHDVNYQGGFLYEPDGGRPYLILALSGRLYKILVDTDSSVTEITSDALHHPENEERFYFVQGEQFLIVQAGDNETLPLIWDGTTLRRSNGLVSSAVYRGRITNAGWTMPAVGSTVNLTLDTPFGGTVGDVLMWPDALGLDGTTVTSYSSIHARFQVTVAAGTNVTLKLLDTTTPASIQGANVPLIWVPTPEIPSATAMDYYMGRIWYARGRTYSAGDIVKGPTGTSAYNFRDSILKVTENPLAVGGDGFTVPGEAGNIRALAHTAEINTALGQGQLYIFTRKSIYRLSVPVSRTSWIAASDSTQPLQTVVQTRYGTVSDRCVVHVNSDLFYQTMEPGIRSLALSVRNDTQWGNTPISHNENRILQFNDRELMRFASGIEFGNRLLMTALPTQTPAGVAFQALVPLDFDLISTLEEKRPPAWEGMQEGLDILQLFEGDFGGRQRAFAAVRSRATRAANAIQVWELTDYLKTDFNQTGEARVQWVTETPAYTWGQEFLLKKLVGGELWVDRVHGEVVFLVEYRPDGDPCWHFWNQWKICSARNSCENVTDPVCYPIEEYPEGYKQTMALPKPQDECAVYMARPVNLGYQFQARITVLGWCRIRGFIMHGELVEKSLYYGLQCPAGSDSANPNPIEQTDINFSSSEVFDPVLGPPYPPVGYQMNEASRTGNLTLLTWTVPGLIVEVNLELVVPFFSVIQITNYDGGNTLASQVGDIVTLSGPADRRFVSTAQEVGTQVRWSHNGPNAHEIATIVEVLSPTTARVAENQVVAAGKFTYWNPNTVFKLYVRNPVTLAFEVQTSVPPETTQNGFIFNIEDDLDPDLPFGDFDMGPNWQYAHPPDNMTDAYVTASVNGGAEVFSPIFQIFQLP